MGINVDGITCWIKDASLSISSHDTKLIPPFTICMVLLPLVTCLLSPTLLVTVIATIGVTSLIYARFNMWTSDDSPILYYKDSDLAKYIIRKCSRLSKPMEVPLYLRNGHVQTMLASLLPEPYFQFRRQYLEMKDGGTVALDWGYVKHNRTRKTWPVIIVLPGYTDDAEDFSFLCKRAQEKGFRCVVFNKRGHGNSPLTTPKLQSFSDPSDLRQVLKYIRTSYPCAKLVAIGSRTGSELLLSYLGEYGSSSYLSAGVCISPIYDSDQFYNGGISKLYEWILLFGFKKLLCRHALALSKVIDVDSALRTNSLAKFEEKVYCKLYGYENIDQYWERNNPIADADDIAIPVLCINALDDPVWQRSSIPLDLFRACPNFLLVTTKHGGHSGFLHRHDMTSWAEKLGLDYISAVLDFTQKYDRKYACNMHV